MRDIKFRALRDDLPCFFVYGYLLYGNNGVPRIAKDCGGLSYTCLKGTVGQYTGLWDRNLKKIYEGDILSIMDAKGNHLRTAEVVWHDACGTWDTKVISIWDKGEFKGIENAHWTIATEVIGNIHEVDNEKTME